MTDDDDDDEASDEALYDDDRALSTHVLRVTTRARDDDALAAHLAALRWTAKRDARVVELERARASADDDDDARAMDVTIAWRCRACSSEDARLERRVRAWRATRGWDAEATTTMTAPGYVPLGSIDAVTKETLDWGRKDRTDEERVAAFADAGVATCLKAVDEETTREIREATERFVERVERRFEESFGDIVYGRDRFAFREIGSRGGERFDALVDLELEEWATLRALARDDAPWRALVDALMPNGWNVHVSVVYSRPGAKNQEWHADGRHLDVECDVRTGCGHAPPYGVCVFMPLIDLSRETGFTQFFMRSHKTSKLIGFGDASSILRLSFDGILDAGQSVAYDYRLLHRGMANDSLANRPVLQFLYTAPAYRETKNYGTRSLWSSQ
jgi:ectoine hydroxylase-related dioxygenase (phytanoyl-CoA dioxygenase family)